MGVFLWLLAYWMIQEGCISSLCNALPVSADNEQLEWTIFPWTECSVTCGGGLQARSVRCVDSDGVIQNSCDPQNRPPSYRFCGLRNCTTHVSAPDTIVPPSGQFVWTSRDGANIALKLENLGNGLYEIHQNITVSDGSSIFLMLALHPPVVVTHSITAGPPFIVQLQQSNGLLFLNVDNTTVMKINDVVKFEEGSSFVYNGYIISSPDGAIVPQNVDWLVFYDSFLFYQFRGSKNNAINGPGSLYLDSDTGSALYSTGEELNAALDSAILLSTNLQAEEQPSVMSGLTLTAASFVSESTTVLTEEPVEDLVLSVRLVNDPYERLPFVTVVNGRGEVIFELSALTVQDQVIEPEEIIMYQEREVLILMGGFIVSSYRNIKEILHFDRKGVSLFRHFSPESIPGGGQLFVTYNRAFFSMDTHLNDQIGEAILTVELQIRNKHLGPFVTMDSASNTPLMQPPVRHRASTSYSSRRQGRNTRTKTRNTSSSESRKSREDSQESTRLKSRKYWRSRSKGRSRKHPCSIHCVLKLLTPDKPMFLHPVQVTGHATLEHRHACKDCYQ